jgi:arsenate reductase
MKTVLFACVHNAGRSQMAAALFNRLADPEVVAVMNEVGIDLSGATTTRLTPELAGTTSLLITMGCGDECPYVPGVIRDDWPLEDPKGKSIDTVRSIREEIRRRVERLIANERWAR